MSPIQRRLASNKRHQTTTVEGFSGLTIYPYCKAIWTAYPSALLPWLHHCRPRAHMHATTFTKKSVHFHPSIDDWVLGIHTSVWQTTGPFLAIHGTQTYEKICTNFLFVQQAALHRYLPYTTSWPKRKTNIGIKTIPRSGNGIQALGAREWSMGTREWSYNAIFAISQSVSPSVSQSFILWCQDLNHS